MEITGTLRMNDLDKWEIVYGRNEDRVIELSSGSVCEVQIGGHWIRTSIEYCHGWTDPGRGVPIARGDGPACGAWSDHPGHYYATERGVLLCAGLLARIALRW
jgi:hypothetical protein